jgi:CBS domain-containing protein
MRQARGRVAAEAGQNGIRPAGPEPVKDNLAWVVPEADRVPAALGASNSRIRGTSMLVREIMTRDIAAIDIDSSILDAAVKMKLFEIGMVVVSQGGQPAGVVTDRDIVVRGVADGADPTFFTVRRLMTTQLISCREDDSVERAAELMQAGQVRRLVVVDARGEPVGILSLADIARRGADEALVGRILRGVTEPTEIEMVRPHREG